ncbi:MAG: nucleotidyltransferase family protein [Ruminococcus sp.]|nr:nucleotidyltransferase family protein [Ruminococcus sp.]
MNRQEQILIQSVLATVSGRDVPKCDNTEGLVNLAKYHMVQNIIAGVLEKMPDVPQNLMNSVNEEQTLLLIKDANQEADTTALMKLFEENEIPVVFLKGWYLKQFYPRTDLRAMADTDIFIRLSDEKKINELMKSHGYSVVTYGGKKDNVYKKEPFIILELHKNLFMFEDDWNDYFNRKDSDMYIWNRVHNVNNHKYIYRMDDELFFTYMIAHIAKHLIDDGGIGMKSILDVWLFLRKKNDLNFEIINRDLESLGLKKFSDSVISLTKYWFDEKDDVDSKTKLLGDHILSCGVYGNDAVMVATKDGILSDSSSRFKYLFRRAFPAVKAMEVRYPQLKRKKWLLPFLYIKRLWFSLVHRSGEVKGEIRSAKNLNYERAKKIQTLYKDIGLR